MVSKPMANTLNTVQEILYKQFQKSPENPCVAQWLGLHSRICRLIFSLRRFNQVTVAYDASKDEKHEALKEKHEAVQKRLQA